MTAFMTVFLSGTLFMCFCIVSAADLRQPFFTLRRFLPYTPYKICQSTASATDLRELFLLSGVIYLTLHLEISRNGILHQPAFIKVSLGAGTFFWRVAGRPTEVRNTNLAYLFVRITQCSAKGIN